jgi:hypothetical protein
MTSLVFENVWGNPSAPEVAKVQQLWRRHGVLKRDDVIESRSRQIVFVVANRDGEVGGVSTARPIQGPFLNNNFFYEFRCFVVPSFRSPGLDSLLALKTKDFLETLPESGSKYKGIVMLIENEVLKKQRTKAVWPATGMVFAGYTSQGHHIRIGYFKGARI